MSELCQRFHDDADLFGFRCPLKSHKIIDLEYFCTAKLTFSKRHDTKMMFSTELVGEMLNT